MRKVTLGEVLDVRRGTSLSGEHYATSGRYKRLTLGNFNYPGGGFKENTSKADIFFTGSVKPEFILKKGAIITPLTEQVRGLLGETARIPEGDTYIQSGDVGLIIPDEKVLDPSFAYYLISSPVVKAQLDAASQQTKIRHTSPDAIKRCVAWIPELDVQKRIGALLDSINEKVSNNNSIISELEAMAKDIYDYWFVQFDFPDENGRPYKSSGGKMVWNEELKREIPERWESHALCEYIRECKNGDWGNDSPKSESDLAVRCFRGADFPSITSNYNMTAPLRYISAKNSNRLLSEGDLVVEISGGSPTQSTGRIGYINSELLSRSEYPMDCSNFCKAFSPTSVNYTYWMFNTWSRLYEASVLFNYESKTTGIKNLMFDDFTKSMKVAVPPEEILVRFHKLVGVLYSKTQASMKESSELAALRDWLLPMLMNGQVKVGKKELVYEQTPSYMTAASKDELP